MKITEILNEDDYYPPDPDQARAEDVRAREAQLTEFIDNYITEYLGAPHRGGVSRQSGHMKIFISIPRRPTETMHTDQLLLMQDDWRETANDIQDELRRLDLGNFGRNSIGPFGIELEEMSKLYESNDTFRALLKAAGYKPGTTYHQPTRDKHAGMVSKLEALIKQAGFERTKSSNSSEYQYQYDVNGEPIVFNYRFGNQGLPAWWKANLNETTSAGGIATVVSGAGAPAFTRGASVYGKHKTGPRKKKKAGNYANSVTESAGDNRTVRIDTPDVEFEIVYDDRFSIRKWFMTAYRKSADQASYAFTKDDKFTRNIPIKQVGFNDYRPFDTAEEAGMVLRNSAFFKKANQD